MSVHAVKWAWSQQVGNSTRKLVLVALADHANSDGECWPTLARVAEFAECDSRTVQRHIVELERGGLVERAGRRDRSDGRFSMRTYRLLMDADRQLESTGQQRPSDNLSSGHEGPTDDVTNGREGRCPSDTTVAVHRTLVSGKELSVEPSGEPSGSPRPADTSPQGFTVDEAFEKWWATYPQRHGKKVGKGNARAEFRKLTWEQRRRAYWGAVNLAKSDTLPKDPERFLRKSSKSGEFPFDDWQQPGDPPAGSNGLAGLAEVF